MGVIVGVIKGLWIGNDTMVMLSILSDMVMRF